MEREERAGGYIGREDNMFSAGMLVFRGKGKEF